MSKTERAWNNPDGFGALLSATAPLAATMIENGLIFTFGAMKDSAYDATGLAPPGWVVGAIWTVIYPMWGLARWRTWNSGPKGPASAAWITALIVWGLLYPLGSLFWATRGSAVANVLSLLLCLVATWRAAKASRTAGWLMAPSVVWLCYASYLGWAAVRAMGPVVV